MDDVTDPDSFNDDAEFGEDDMDGTEPLLSGQQVTVSKRGEEGGRETEREGGWEREIEGGKKTERKRGRDIESGGKTEDRGGRKEGCGESGRGASNSKRNTL